MSDEVAPKPKKRRWRLTLGAMMLLILVLGVWLARTADRARRQRRAVDAVTRMGGFVQYAHERTELGQSIPNPRLPGPKWLRDLLGPEYFQEVIEVSTFNRSNPRTWKESTFASLSFLDDLPDLRTLNLGVALTPAAEFAHLKGLRLRNLILSGTSFGDRGLSCISGMKSLKFLSVGGCPLTQAGLAPLWSMPQLEGLMLERLKLDDGVADGLSGLRNLESLALGGTGLTDVGLKKLAGLEKLKNLYLHDTKVTDRGLGYLSGMKSLKLLTLTGAAVTPEGVKGLQSVLTGAKIIYRKPRTRPPAPAPRRS